MSNIIIICVYKGKTHKKKYVIKSLKSNLVTIINNKKIRFL